MNYDVLKDQMQTGDVILFEGQYSISRIIEKVTGCPYSHVGMVIRLEGYEEPLLFESTTLTNLPDVLTGDTKEGPKIVDLKQRLLHYGEEVKPYRKPSFVYHPIHFRRTESTTERLLACHTLYHGRYETSDKQMMLDVILGRIFGIQVSKKEFFCSELIAVLYMAIDLLHKKPPYNAYMPKDFSSLNHYIHLVQAQFGQEIPIDMDEGLDNQ